MNLESTANAPGPVAHVVSVKVLFGVWAALLALTLATVVGHGIDLGAFNLHLAMAIATVKAALVVLYFMHMRDERPVNAVVFIVALGFVALFIVFAMVDTSAYHDELIPGYAPALRK